ncbi:hypothetical protein [Rosistilla oblonga]|uniref:hypothetical protein n=1 Tax=Rosistilla oblonga TaxID=2527990 RepID=UPI003A97CE9D
MPWWDVIDELGDSTIAKRLQMVAHQIDVDTAAQSLVSTFDDVPRLLKKEPVIGFQPVDIGGTLTFGRRVGGGHHRFKFTLLFFA